MHLFFAFSTYSKAKRQLGKKSIINLQTAFANSASQAPFFLPFPQNPYTTSLSPLNNTGICPSTPTFIINNIHSHPACPHYCHKKKQPTEKFKQPGNLFLQSRTRKHQVAGFFLRQTNLITYLYEKGWKRLP